MLTPFIGRDQEKAQLRDFLTSKPDTIGHCILTIIGGKGLGKTRLVCEVLRDDAGAKKILRCDAKPWSKKASLSVVSELIRDSVGLRADPIHSDLVAALEQILDEFGITESHTRLKIHRLAGSTCNPDFQVNPEKCHEIIQELYKAFERFLCALGGRAPLTIFVDNADLIDTHSIDFITKFIAESNSIGAQVITTAEGITNALIKSGTTMQMQALSRAEASELQSHFTSKISDEFTIPEYVGDDVSHDPPPPVPENTLAQSRFTEEGIRQRVDSLNDRLRSVIECGAVMGAGSFMGALSAVMVSKKKVGDALLDLRGVQQLHQQATADRVDDILISSMAREVVLDSIPRERLQDIHASIAAGLEDSVKEGSIIPAGQIAHHWGRAGFPVRSARHMLEAAKQSMRVGDIDNVVSVSEDLIAEVKRNGDWQNGNDILFEACLLCAWALRLKGDVDESLDYLRIGLRLARQGASEERTLRVLVDLGVCYIAKGRNDRAKRLLEAALKMSVGGRTDLHCRCHLALGNIAWGCALHDIAILHYSSAVEHAQLESVVWAEADGQNNIGMAHWLQGNLEQAKGALERSLALWRTCSNCASEVLVACNLGVINEQLGDFSMAYKHYCHSLEVARDIGQAQVEASAHVNLSCLNLLGLNWGPAQKHAAEGIVISERIKDRRTQSVGLENLALSELGLGLDSMETAQCAVEVAKSIGDASRQASAYLTCAEILLGQSRTHEASERLREASSLIEEFDLGLLRISACRLSLELQCVGENSDVGHRDLQHAVSLVLSGCMGAEEVKLLRFFRRYQSLMNWDLGEAVLEKLEELNAVEQSLLSLRRCEQ